MGYEQEAFRKLMSNIWGKKSRMQEEMSKGAKGEPFIVQELSRKGPQTPTQLAAAMRATTGRVSTLLSVLEKKGQITREIDPNDRRIVHVSLTEAGERRAEKQREDMREAVCWIFSQMGERRTREFVDLAVEFTTCACRASHVPLRSRSGRPSARQVAPTAQQADGVRGLSWRGAIRGDAVEPLWQYRGGRRSVSVCAMSCPVELASSQPCGRGRQCVPIVRGCAATNSGKPCNRKSLSGNTQKRA